MPTWSSPTQAGLSILIKVLVHGNGDFLQPFTLSKNIKPFLIAMRVVWSWASRLSVTGEDGRCNLCEVAKGRVHNQWKRKA